MVRAERPVIQLTPSTGEQALDWASLLGLIFTLAVLAASWSSLPERVPSHFGASGQPDAWGSRNTFWLFVVLPLVVHVALGLLARKPHLYSYPTRVTPENAEQLYRLGRGMIYWLRAGVVWLVAYLCWGAVRVAQGRAAGLNSVIMYALLCVIFATVIWFTLAMFRGQAVRSD